MTAALTTQPVPVDASAAKGEAIGWVKRTNESHPIGLAQPSDWRFTPHEPKLEEGLKAEWFDVLKVYVQPVPAPDSGSLSPASGWRRIETPPKDACGALLYYPAGAIAETIAGQNYSLQCGWWNGKRWLEQGTSHDIFDEQEPEHCPTHWQPLPLPPANSSEPG